MTSSLLSTHIALQVGGDLVEDALFLTAFNLSNIHGFLRDFYNDWPYSLWRNILCITVIYVRSYCIAKTHITIYIQL